MPCYIVVTKCLLGSKGDWGKSWKGDAWCGLLNVWKRHLAQDEPQMVEGWKWCFGELQCMLALFFYFPLVMHIAYCERQETEQGVGGKFCYLCCFSYPRCTNPLYPQRWLSGTYNCEWGNCPPSNASLFKGEWVNSINGEKSLSTYFPAHGYPRCYCRKSFSGNEALVYIGLDYHISNDDVTQLSGFKPRELVPSLAPFPPSVRNSLWATWLLKRLRLEKKKTKQTKTLRMLI